MACTRDDEGADLHQKTDVWALGILSWEIFENGKAPYAHIPNNNEVAIKVG